MAKYRVYGHCTIVCAMEVDAKSEEEAIEKANEEFGGLTNYVGMGSCSCLVGVLSSDNGREIYPDDDPIFDDCKEIGGKHGLD